MKGMKCGGVAVNKEQAVVEYIKKHNGEWVSAENIAKNITPKLFRKSITHRYIGLVGAWNSDIIEHRAIYLSRERNGYLAEYRYKTEVRG